MKVSDFHYDLPPELIAQHPPAQRGDSRMLVMDRASGAVRDAMFRELPRYLRRGDLLVLNDSRVLPARLFARRAAPGATGTIEVLLTSQLDPADPTVWTALVRPAKKVVPGETLLFYGSEDEEPPLRAEVLTLGCYGERTLRFAPVDDFLATVSRIGHMPLPPYIRRDQANTPDSEEDREHYQTVYAREPGSAAAPTAGLHFTPVVLAQLEAAGVEIRRITLHVGLGTFQPVRVEEVADIRLHAERYTLPPDTAAALRQALAENRGVVAVGTTTTRTLEHIAALALAAGEGGWHERIQPHAGSTSIFLAPGHRFRIVSGLLTNFHLPESTLLMLVSAFAGREQVLAAYRHAVEAGYRFYSYGDCMLLS